MQTTEEQQAYDAVYRYAHEQMSRGVPDARVQQALVAQGWDADVARAITDNLRAQSRADAAGGPPPLPVDVKPAAKVTPNHYTPTAYTPAAKPRAKSGGGSGGGRDLLVGGVICAIGLAVTFGTYAAANGRSGGGRYTVAWGAILFGAIQFFKGLAKLGGGGGDE
jgi:hypothetical protein